MDAEVPAETEVPPDLLERIRAMLPEGRHQFREVLAGIASGAINVPGSGRADVRVSLLAYHEIENYDQSSRVEGLAKIPPEAVLQLNEIHRFALRFDVARALMKIYAQRWPGARAVRVHAPIIGDVQGPQDEFRDVAARDVQIVAKPGASTTVAVFCALPHGFGMPLNVMHHCLLSKHNVNVVYLRDFDKCLYLRGIKSLGDVDQTCLALREQFARLKAQNLVFAGYSGGSFAALYYASLLGADRAVLFSGPTSLDLGAAESERQVFARLHTLHSEGKVAWPNLREIYATCRTSVSMFYGEENPVDTLQAQNLQGLPTVTLKPVPSPHHFTLDYLAISGDLDGVFADAFAFP